LTTNDEHVIWCNQRLPEGSALAIRFDDLYLRHPSFKESGEASTQAQNKLDQAEKGG
jgi:hypothetical protein